MSSEKVIHLNSYDEFESQVLKSDKPVVVDFWAPWCGPCKTLSPLLDELAEQNDKIKVVKVNVDDHQDLANQYGIRGIPALLVFKEGQLLGTKVGAHNKQQLFAFVDEKVG